jgi:amino acid permease
MDIPSQPKSYQRRFLIPIFIGMVGFIIVLVLNFLSWLMTMDILRSELQDAKLPDRAIRAISSALMHEHMNMLINVCMFSSLLGLSVSLCLKLRKK